MFLNLDPTHHTTILITSCCNVLEGFGGVARVCCQAAAFESALKLGGPIPFHKFSCTEHPGAVTDNDLILTTSLTTSLQADIAGEEKEDSSCMGISLASHLSTLYAEQESLQHFRGACTVCKSGVLGGLISAEACWPAVQG